MPHLDSFFDPHSHTTRWFDDQNHMVGLDQPDGVGGTLHSDGLGHVTGHTSPDGIGGSVIHDGHHATVGLIHHDPLGHTHLTDASGHEIAQARPNVFHGHDLFLPDGSHMATTMDLGGGHTHIQADPLVGMNSIRFSQF